LKGFDVVIIGGGLSGSSTALNLSKKGYSVLIIEKEKFQDYKPCAGGMASSMQKFLPLDITDSIESKIKNVEFRWKASDNVVADLTGESPFWIIKREKLDQLLLDESLSNGVQILDTITKNCFVKQLGPRNFKIILTQGLNRQIRRMCEALGYRVESLKRVRIMNIKLDLPKGEYREFSKEELLELNTLLENSSKTYD